MTSPLTIPVTEEATTGALNPRDVKGHQEQPFKRLPKMSKTTLSFSDRIVKEALTFDDVLMVPAHSTVLPCDTNLESQLAPSFDLNVPVISAAMDTVTESRMAVALAKAGGLGIIHKNMSIEKQADEVRKVKKYEAGILPDPVCINPETTLAEIRKLVTTKGFSTFPVVDKEQKVLGIVSNRDFKYLLDPRLQASEFMTPRDKLITVTKKPQSRTPSRRDSDECTTPIGRNVPVSRQEVRDLMTHNRVEKLVVVDEADRIAGLITHHDFIAALQEVGQLKACRDREGNLRCGAAVGCAAETMDRVEALVEAGVDLIVVDSSHGHSQGVLDTVAKVRAAYPSLVIVGGNVCTGDGAKALVEAGASIIKVGVGPGSICSTRVVTGCGGPQLSAIADCAEALQSFDYHVPIIADGGIRFSGDLAKALAAGASACMMGSVFAGTDEAPGDVEIFDGRPFKTYRGMGSLGAMENGSADRYFQDKKRKLVPEGVEGLVPYRGAVRDIIALQIGGLRSAMGLTGCANLQELAQKVKFVRITSTGLQESHPHTITISKEAPNYSSSNRTI